MSGIISVGPNDDVDDDDYDEREPVFTNRHRDNWVGCANHSIPFLGWEWEQFYEEAS